MPPHLPGLPCTCRHGMCGKGVHYGERQPPTLWSRGTRQRSLAQRGAHTHTHMGRPVHMSAPGRRGACICTCIHAPPPAACPVGCRRSATRPRVAAPAWKVDRQRADGSIGRWMGDGWETDGWEMDGRWMDGWMGDGWIERSGPSEGPDAATGVSVTGESRESHGRVTGE